MNSITISYLKVGDIVKCKGIEFTITEIGRFGISDICDRKFILRSNVDNSMDSVHEVSMTSFDLVTSERFKIQGETCWDYSLISKGDILVKDGVEYVVTSPTMWYIAMERKDDGSKYSHRPDRVSQLKWGKK